MEQAISGSLRQLSPTTRYYIRKLLLTTLEAINTRRQDAGEAGLDITYPGQSSEELDISIETLLNQNGQGADKIVELERLALLFQGLSSEGTTFRTQMMSMVEDKVANLLGLALVTPSMPDFQPEEPSQTLQTSQPTQSSQPKASQPPLTNPKPRVTVQKPAPQPETLYEYLTMFNVISRISKKYLGASVTVKNWGSCRPEDEWLAEIQISETGEFCQVGADFRLTPEQQALLQAWITVFANRCSRVIYNFESLLQAAKIYIPADS